MKYEIKFTSQFKKDLKLAKKQNKKRPGGAIYDIFKVQVPYKIPLTTIEV